MKKIKVCFYSLGCVKNLVDSECILGILKNQKIEIIDNVESSDIIFINTCGFIESAKKESINTILSVCSQKKSTAKVVVVGCLAKRYKKELYKEIPEIDLIIGVDEYDKIGEILNKLISEIEFPQTFSMLKRTLTNPLPVAYLKIGEGCSNRCAYCAIPLIRGDYVSYKKEEIIEDAKRLIKLGKNELIIIAQDPTRYGRDLYENYFLEDLVEDLVNINPLVKYRILYLYPDRISKKFVDLFNKYPNLIPYFDIPIQHSSNKMLELMARSGTREKYIDIINYIKKVIPHAVLRTTIIVGFPQETQEDIEDLIEFIEEIKFDHLGVFTFSNEEDTPAYLIKNDVSKKEARKRQKLVMEVQQKISLEKNLSRIGEIQSVLIEDFNGEYYIGRSYVFAPDAEDGNVYVKSNKKIIIGEYIDVLIEKASPYDLYGKVIDKGEK